MKVCWCLLNVNSIIIIIILYNNSKNTKLILVDFAYSLYAGKYHTKKCWVVSSELWIKRGPKPTFGLNNLWKNVTQQLG